MDQLPGGCNPLLIIGLVIIPAVCVLPLILIFGLGVSNDTTADFPTMVPLLDAPAESELNQQSSTKAPEPMMLPPASSDGQTWLVMLYQDADDKTLEQDIYFDLNEAERVGSSDRVHIVAQVDRFSAGYQGDGNWSDTKRFYITQDGDLQRVSSQQVESLGESNMSSGETLVDFVTWAVDNFPADRHVLIMADHGMGWPGGGSDPNPGGRDDSNIPMAKALGDQLFLMELDEALEEIRAQTGLEQFELVGMDTCLMGHIEVFSALAPHARYAVASQETELAMG
ncbi:MAG TPA: clostripain-related cysteine peptidase [Patescibacteria group bacterium]|nr:clostripain-related cysteine peptidase [Patescibacteria group bacterium]